MSTTATPVAAAAPKVSVWKNILQHVVQFFEVGLTDVIKYTPAAENLAAVLFPEYAGLEKAAGDTVVSVATLLQNTVLTVEQKYSDAAKSDENNAQKLADALTIAAPVSLKLLQSVGVSADTSRITAAINAVVAILKTSPAPAA